MSGISIRFKLVGVVAASLALVFLFSVMLAERASERAVQRVALEAVTNAQQTFDRLIDADADMLGATLEVLRDRDDLRELYLAQDREALFDYAQPLFGQLKTDYAITHWYFETTEEESTIFVRIHNRDIFDDSIGRITYLQAVRSGSIGSGLELGKTAFAVRVVKPYFDSGGALIGYMELGKEIGEFLDLMKSQTGDDFAMVVSKQYLDQAEWASVNAARGTRNNWEDHPTNLLVETTTDDSAAWQYDGDIMVVPPSGRVLDVVSVDDRTLVRGVFPLEDAAGRRVGVVMLTRDVDSYLREGRESRIRALVALAAAVVIVGLLLVVLLDRLVFARLSRVMHHLEDMSAELLGGDYDASHYHLEATRKDEIGRFERSMGEFLARIATAMRETGPRRRP